MQTAQGLKALNHKISTSRLPKIELEINFNDFLENNLEDIQNPNKMI